MIRLKTLIPAFAIFIMTNITVQAQTTVNLANQCNCEVIKSSTEVNPGATTPAGADVGDLLIDPSGDLYFWDGDSWELPTAAQKSQPWFDAATNMEATSNTQDIYQMGNVGIGTTNPAVDLHIVDTLPIMRVGTIGGTRGEIQLGNSFHGVKRNFAGDANDVGLHTDFGDIHLSADGEKKDQFKLSSTGNVGIGTDAPSTKLDVNGNARVRTLPAGAAADGIVTTDANGNLRQRTAAEIVAEGGGGADGDAWNVTGEDQASAISRTGNVGIGTTNPTEKLEVAGKIATTNELEIGQLGSGDRASYIDLHAEDGVSFSTRMYRFAGANGLLLFENEGTGDIRFDVKESGSSTDFAIDGATANIGIGTSAPFTDLHIVDTLPILRIGTTDGTRGEIQLGNSFHGLKRNFAGDINDVGLHTDFGDLHLSADGEKKDQFKLSSTGNVGIGTDAPSTKLDVNGNARVRTLPAGAAADGIVTTDANGNLRQRTAAEIVAEGGGGADGDAWAVTGEDQTSAISRTGNVGIGTTNPTEKLEVAGKIATTNELEIGQLGSGDRASYIDLHAEDNVSFSTRMYRFPGADGAMILENNGAGDLRFYTNNSGSTADLTIDGPTANIGIGTSAPFTDLHIVDTLPILRIGTTAGTRGAIEFGNGFHGLKRDFAGDVNDVGLYTDFGDIHLSADGEKKDQFKLTSTGDVGIGTDAPIAKLDVNGKTNIGSNVIGDLGDLVVGDADGSVTSSIYSKSFNNASIIAQSGITGSSNSSLVATLSNAVARMTATSGPTTKIESYGNYQAAGIPAGVFSVQDFSTGKIFEMLATPTEHKISSNLGTGTAEMYFNDGNIGIGTANPSAKFHITGGDNTQSITSATTNVLSKITNDQGGSVVQLIESGDRAVRFGINPTFSNLGGDGVFSFVATSTRTGETDSDVFVYDYANENLCLLPNLLNTGNNVGIGILEPQEKLHVDGNILATGTITPDYVFQKYFDGESTLKPEYKMMSLSEIESFTKINKHLPGVPSAQEVAAKGGIMVNRSTELNLEKIEELFLHTIEQEKKIQELEEQLSELEALKAEMAKIKSLLGAKK